MKKFCSVEVIRLLEAARVIYDDANDRGETHGEDGKEYPDFKALRVAIEEVEASYA